MFGMVLQDTWLFSGTIRDNIAYGREGASEDEIVQAARAAQADHFIRTLPDNYDTMINEEATNLSQGQKQLLTIARAFLADPAILILDEATSSVDTRTEVLIQKAMARLMHGRTTFVIAHRLSTIRKADVILMMEHGRIVEKGTHDDAAGGRRPLCGALSEPVRRAGGVRGARVSAVAATHQPAGRSGLVFAHVDVISRDGSRRGAGDFRCRAPHRLGRSTPVRGLWIIATGRRTPTGSPR